jgi:hypothetical protein
VVVVIMPELPHAEPQRPTSKVASDERDGEINADFITDSFALLGTVGAKFGQRIRDKMQRS